MCKLIDCVDYADNTPLCECEVDYTKGFSWNSAHTEWEGETIY
jgi:hypothetical protein